MDGLRSTKEKRSSFEIIASSDDDFGAGYKPCKQCGMIQPLDAYRAEPKGIGGRKAICRACLSERTIKSPPKKGTISNDRIQKALEAAAYRIIKESM